MRVRRQISRSSRSKGFVGADAPPMRLEKAVVGERLLDRLGARRWCLNRRRPSSEFALTLGLKIRFETDAIHVHAISLLL